MHDTDQLAILADMDTCQLNHGPEDPPKAVDVIVQRFGYMETPLVEVCKFEVVIPICMECLRSIQGHRWTLAYCFSCNASVWFDRRASKLSYRHDILWLRGCPDCTGKFGGIYFTDPVKKADGVPILNEMRECK